MYLAGWSYAPPCSEHAGWSLAIGRLKRCLRYPKPINHQRDVAKALASSNSARTSKAPVGFEGVSLIAYILAIILVNRKERIHVSVANNESQLEFICSCALVESHTSYSSCGGNRSRRELRPVSSQPMPRSQCFECTSSFDPFFIDVSFPKHHELERFLARRRREM
jgi:hypothetical protein